MLLDNKYAARSIDVDQEGNILVGSKISSSENELILDTDMGVFKIKKDDYFLCIQQKSTSERFLELITIYLLTSQIL